MNFNFNDDDLWREFGDPNESWENRVQALFKLAGFSASNGDFAKERKLLENAAELAQTHGLNKLRYRILNILALRSLYGDSDSDEAIRIADIIISAEPDFITDDEIADEVITAYYRKGSGLIHQKRFAEAVNVFNLAVSYVDLLGGSKMLAEGYTALMRCHIELEDLKQAKRFGEKAREIYQSKERIAERLEMDRLFGWIYLEEGNYVRAIQELREVRVLERRLFRRSDVETKVLLGRAYLAAGDLKKAEKVLRRVFTESIQPWAGDVPASVMAGPYLVRCLEMQGKTDEAASIRFECQAISARLSQAKVQDVERKILEIQNLNLYGKHDLAVVACQDLLESANNAGDISLRWKVIELEMESLWGQDDFEGIVSLWDSARSEGLNYQDQVVIRIKNMVSHALRKVGRVQEAAKVNIEVRSDKRTETDQTEFLYAKENEARIQYALKNYREARKLKDEVVKEYLEIGNAERALGLIKFFDKSKNSSQD